MDNFKYKKLINIFVLISLWIIPVVNAAELPLISEIKVEGLRAIERDAVLNVIQSHVGGIYTPDNIPEDIKKLYQTGFFENIIVDKSEANKQVILTIRVEEKPTIRNIVFKGSYAISVSDLQEKIVSKKYNLIDEKKIGTDIKTIKQLYIEKGYYLVTVTYELKDVEPGVVDIVYKIDPHYQVKVRDVLLMGNKYFSKNELEEGLVTKKTSWLSFMTPSQGFFKDEFVMRDQQYLNYFYRDNGFAEANISEVVSSLDPMKKYVDVSFYIEEGPMYYVGQVDVSGELLEGHDFSKDLELKTGKVFRISNLSHDLTKLQQIYGDEGYAFAYIDPLTYLDKKDHKANIEFQIRKGEKAYIGSITTEGNVKTFDNVLRRELKISEGQLYNYSAIEESQKNLDRLGFFESAEIVKDMDEVNHIVNLRVIVKEKSTGILNASMGGSPAPDSRTVRLIAQASYSEINFLGRAYSTSVNFNAAPSPKPNTQRPNWSLGVSLMNPSINDTPWSAGFGLQYSIQDNDILSVNAGDHSLYVTQESVALSFSVGREIIEDLRISFELGFSNVHTTPSNPITRTFFNHGLTESVSQKLSYDKTNSFQNPTDGYSFVFKNTIGANFIKGENYFGKMLSEFAYYYPISVTEKVLTNFRFTFRPGYVYELYRKPVPIWQRFQLGDMYSMKAYMYDPIAPKRKVLLTPLTATTYNYLFNGNRMLYSSLEYFIPIVPEANLRFVTFAEAGAVLNDNDHFDLKHVKYDAGFGFRWATALAQFRFEWAWRLEPGRGLKSPEFVFSVGSDTQNTSGL
jgi:outer membrane protein insertion porin family